MKNVRNYISAKIWNVRSTIWCNIGDNIENQIEGV